MKKIIYIFTAMIMCASLSSCDGYLDINTDPNAPAAENITSDMIFPGMEMAVAATYGDLLRIPCGYFAQYYSQTFGTSNYLDYSQFAQSNTRCSSAYSQFFQKGINNAATVMKKAEAQEQWGTYLAATTLKAFSYATLVDMWGEVPYSEALNADITTPKYDDGLDVYKGIIAEIDNALAKVSPADVVCTNFLFPGEKADAWMKFANALKLRLLTRMAGTENVDATLKNLIDEGNFPASDVAFANCWANGSGLESPFYSEEFSTNFGSTQQNIIANIALVGSMQYTSGDDEFVDGRLGKFFKANNSGKFQGGVSGTNFDGNASSGLKNAAAWCRPVASYDMPVVLLSVSDIYFYIAEYHARKGDSGEAEKAYEMAVLASFNAAGANGSEAYLAEHPYLQDNWKETIGVAKWLANAGSDPVEGYTELRRLDYPSFGTAQGSDIYNITSGVYTPANYEPFHLYTPLRVYEHVGADKLLERFPYAESSSSRNPNCPKFTNADFVKPIFWGK